MEIKNSLKTILKRLKLSGILATLPERIAYAQKTKLPSEDLLELILQDEVDRRDQVNLQRRLKRASFTEEQIFENFDWDAPVGFDRHRVRDLFSLSFLEAKQDVLFMAKRGRRQNLPRFCSRPCSHAGDRIRRHSSSAPTRCSSSSSSLVPTTRTKRRSDLSRPRPAHPRRLRACPRRLDTTQSSTKSSRQARAPSPLINDSHQIDT